MSPDNVTPSDSACQECGATLGCNNTSGFCKRHHSLSPRAKMRSHDHYRRNRTKYLEMARIRKGCRARHTMDKECSKCGNAIRSDNRTGLCTKHNRHRLALAAYHRNPEKTANRVHLKKHGMSLDEKWKMLADQDGLCAICRLTSDTWHTDHDHANGRIRGVLCRFCNNGLGMFRDSPDTLRLAAIYLEVNRG